MTTVDSFKIMAFPRVIPSSIGGRPRVLFGIYAEDKSQDPRPGHRISTDASIIPGAQAPGRFMLMLVYFAIRREWLRRADYVRFKNEYRDYRSGISTDLIPKGWMNAFDR